MTSRYWAQTLAKWEKKILKDGSIMGGKHKTKPPTIPSNICGEYVDAFKKQFTHFHLKGMDEFTAGVLRQFYIISQGKDADYKFFTIVKEELEQDFECWPSTPGLPAQVQFAGFVPEYLYKD